MSDRGIGQQALDVVLYQRTQVPQCHGQSGRDPDQPEASGSVRFEHDAQQNRECRRLWPVDISPTTGAGAPS